MEKLIMKTLIKILGAIALCTSAFVQAEPVMTLITVNTADPAGYAGWAKSNAEKLSKANGAMAMGLCSPTSGAQKMGDHYLWSFFGSQEAAWSADPMNPIQRDHQTAFPPSSIIRIDQIRCGFDAAKAI